MRDEAIAVATVIQAAGRESATTMQLLLGRCPRCNHTVEKIRGQFYCLRCQAFLLDPGKARFVDYRREEYPDSAFWTAERVYRLLHLHNRSGDT